MGIAVRSELRFPVYDWKHAADLNSVAAILHLHREDSYTLAPGHSAADVINAEVARRTFWTLQGK